MKVGDIVKYSWENDHGIGVITHVVSIDSRTVLWADGISTNHSSRWLIRVEEIK